MNVVRDVGNLLEQIMFIRDDLSVVLELVEDDEHAASKLEDIIKRVENLAVKIKCSGT